MGECPYCSKELHLEDFFILEKKETKRGRIKKKARKFKGESIILYGMGSRCKMWECPSCNAILGFTEWGSGVTH